VQASGLRTGQWGVPPACFSPAPHRFPDTIPAMAPRIISIGTLAANPLWGEAAPVRTGHATTTLIRAGDRAILVDPGLPAPAIAARLNERAGLKPEDITHVFLTSFQPATSRGIAAFDHAAWWINAAEREAVGVPLARRLKDAAGGGHDSGEDGHALRELELQVAILKRCRPAPDKLADRVDLFPLPGVTPGLAGLLVSGPRQTTLVCGDAVLTAEHLEHGRIPDSAHDLPQARESFAEAVEIADLLIPGRDNLIVNPTRRPF
jgi:glyoxylase-like metal-dependent hydrolase (beta-lactamase superfamily II)